MILLFIYFSVPITHAATVDFYDYVPDDYLNYHRTDDNSNYNPYAQRTTVNHGNIKYNDLLSLLHDEQSNRALLNHINEHEQIDSQEAERLRRENEEIVDDATVDEAETTTKKVNSNMTKETVSHTHTKHNYSETGGKPWKGNENFKDVTRHTRSVLKILKDLFHHETPEKPIEPRPQSHLRNAHNVNLNSSFAELIENITISIRNLNENLAKLKVQINEHDGYILVKKPINNTVGMENHTNTESDAIRTRRDLRLDSSENHSNISLKNETVAFNISNNGHEIVDTKENIQSTIITDSETITTVSEVNKSKRNANFTSSNDTINVNTADKKAEESADILNLEDKTVKLLSKDTLIDSKPQSSANSTRSKKDVIKLLHKDIVIFNTTGNNARRTTNITNLKNDDILSKELNATENKPKRSVNITDLENSAIDKIIVLNTTYSTELRNSVNTTNFDSDTNDLIKKVTELLNPTEKTLNISAENKSKRSNNITILNLKNDSIDIIKDAVTATVDKTKRNAELSLKNDTVQSINNISESKFIKTEEKGQDIERIQPEITDKSHEEDLESSKDIEITTRTVTNNDDLDETRRNGRRSFNPQGDLLYSIEKTYTDIKNLIAPVSIIKDNYSENLMYKVGYIIANIETMEVSLAKLRNKMANNTYDWDIRRLHKISKKLNMTKRLVTSVMERLSDYVGNQSLSN